MNDPRRNASPFGIAAVNERDLPSYLPLLLRGLQTSVLVRGFLDAASCERITANFMASHGRYARRDGVPATMVGSNGFLKGVDGVVDEYLTNSNHGELLFRGTRNGYRRLLDLVEEGGDRCRSAYADGVPSAVHRAAMWSDASTPGITLQAHTDWPQVANSGMEYADVVHPVGVNMYAAHPPKGESWVRLYDFVPSAQWLCERGIDEGGYPICQQDLTDRDYIDILPEAGDLLLFNAAHVHAVFNSTTANRAGRLNVNGFIGYSLGTRRVLAWA